MNHLLFVAAAVVFAAGWLLGTVAVVWRPGRGEGGPAVPAIVPGQNVNWYVFAAAAAVASLGVALGVKALFSQRHIDRDETEWWRYNRKMFGRYFIGVSYALFLGAAVVLSAMAGLGWNTNSTTKTTKTTKLQDLLASPTTQPSATALESAAYDEHHPTRILVTMHMAVLGALFYLANALRKHRALHPDPTDDGKDGAAPEAENFDRAHFWYGVCFRLGEAVLFSLVIYLGIAKYDKDREWLRHTPLVGLLGGMFVVSLERVIAGLAHRAIAAVATLVPIDGQDLRSCSRRRDGHGAANARRRGRAGAAHG